MWYFQNLWTSIDHFEKKQYWNLIKVYKQSNLTIIYSLLNKSNIDSRSSSEKLQMIIMNHTKNEESLINSNRWWL